MSQKTIAVDIDDVLAAESEYIIRFSNTEWGHDLVIDDYHEDWASLWGVDHVELVRRRDILHQPGVKSLYRILDNAEVAIKELAKSYRLVIVTSRRSVVSAETRDWLEQHFGDIFAEVRFTGFYDTHAMDAHMQTKGDILKDMGVDYLIDDQPKHCLSAASDDIESILFGESVVNKSIQLPKNVTLCKDWQAVQEYFDARRD